MNRTDRLLAIVLELQAHTRRRAADLAATFETSKRTIYRDIQALSEAGVPVVAVPGLGYALQPGYFLPPLTFSTDEAAVLLLGAESLTQHVDAQYRAAAASAGRKIAAVLPEERRAEVRGVQESTTFVTAGPPSDPRLPELLGRLRGAILARRRVRFLYYTRYGSRPPGAPPPGSNASEREADPYTLVQSGGHWYLVAWCHERTAVRRFRLDRIERLQLLDDTFTRPPNLQVRPDTEERPRPLTIRALFSPTVARWVREAPSAFQSGAEELTDGLLVTLRVREVDDALGWLLSWGANVRVLEPDAVRRRLTDEAAKLIANHFDELS